MNLTVVKTGLWTCVTVCSAAAALALANTPQDDKGEKIQNASCTTCHDLRPIQVQALDADGWTKVVKDMMQKGAEVKSDDIPILAEYLAWNYGPLPAGAGKQLVLNKCTLCHDLQRVRQHLATREGWEETLSAMLNEGAMLSDEEFAVILVYLSRNFRPQ